jgi:hypothetical protein
MHDDVAAVSRLVPSEVDPNSLTYSPDNPIHTLLMCAAAHCAE